MPKAWSAARIASRPRNMYPLGVKWTPSDARTSTRSPCSLRTNAVYPPSLPSNGVQVSTYVPSGSAEAVSR